MALAAEGVDLSSVLAVGGAVCTALVAAIGTLWRIHVKANERLEARAEDCERKHEAAGERIVVLTSSVAALEARRDVADELAEPLQKLGDGMLKLAKQVQAIADREGE